MVSVVNSRPPAAAHRTILSQRGRWRGGCPGGSPSVRHGRGGFVGSAGGDGGRGSGVGLAVLLAVVAVMSVLLAPRAGFASVGLGLHQLAERDDRGDPAQYREVREAEERPRRERLRG